MAVGGGSDFASAASDNVPCRQLKRTWCTMSIAELVGLGVLTGLGAGLLAGLVGIGGGVVITMLQFCVVVLRLEFERCFGGLNPASEKVCAIFQIAEKDKFILGVSLGDRPRPDTDRRTT